MTRAVKMLALVPVALLLCAPVGAQAKPSVPDEPVVRAGVDKPLLQADRDYYFTNVARATGETAAADQKVGESDARAQAKKSASRPARGQAKHRVPAGGQAAGPARGAGHHQGRQPARDRAEVGPGQRAAGQAAHPAGRVQSRGQRRLLRLGAAEHDPTNPAGVHHRAGGHAAQRAAAQPDP